VRVKKLLSSGCLNCSTNVSAGRCDGKRISDFRAADVSLLNPEMFTEIEFETNKETKV